METSSLPPAVDDVAPPRRPQGRRRKTHHALPTLPPEEVRGALQRMLASADFPASARNRRFLAYVVETALEGGGEAVTGYEVATEVFGRDKDFNATSDPIVRIEAGKLRRDLETYYLKSGRAESVVISLPRGGYWPVFERRDVSGLAADEVVLDPAGLTVHALHTAHGCWAVEGPDFRAQVVDALTRQPDLAVFTSQAAGPADGLLDSDTARDLARRNGTRFVLSGHARETGNDVLFTARLHDGATGRQVWAEEIGGNGCSLLENLVSRVVEVRRSLMTNGGAGGVA
jgi:hypothetical protein